MMTMRLGNMSEQETFGNGREAVALLIGHVTAVWLRKPETPPASWRTFRSLPIEVRPEATSRSVQMRVKHRGSFQGSRYILNASGRAGWNKGTGDWLRPAGEE